MKIILKKMLMILGVVLIVGVFVACGKGDINKDDNVAKIIKEIDPQANIEAIIRFNNDTNGYDEYNGMKYIVWNPSITAQKNDESFLAQVEELQKRNICQLDNGCLVFLEGSEKPDYFIEKDTLRVFIIKAIKFSSEQDYYVCYTFVSEEDFWLYCELLEEEILYLREYIEECESKKYLLQGEITEQIGDTSIVVYGSAIRNDGEDSYSGEFRLDYEQGENLNIDNGVLCVEGFSLEEDYDDGEYWFDYKAFGTIAATSIGDMYTYEMQCMKDNEIILNELTNGKYELTELQSIEQLEEEWYQKNPIYFNEVTNSFLEIVSYDDGAIDLVFDGLTVYSFDRDSVDENMYPGCYAYVTEEAVLIYKLESDYITIMDDGTYEGDYVETKIR